jgi:hypothetical protein
LRRKARNNVDHEHGKCGKIAYPEEVDDQEELNQEEEDRSFAIRVGVAIRVSVAIGIAVTRSADVASGSRRWPTLGENCFEPDRTG